MSTAYNRYRAAVDAELNALLDPEAGDSSVETYQEKVASAEGPSQSELIEKLAFALEKVAEDLTSYAVQGMGTQSYDMGGRSQPRSVASESAPGFPASVGPRTFMAPSIPGRQETGVKMASVKQLLLNKIASRSGMPGSLVTYAVDEGPTAEGMGTELLRSTEAALGYTPRDAKKSIKEELRALFEEPALSAATDPVLRNNLKYTDEAGAKIASVGGLLRAVRGG